MKFLKNIYLIIIAFALVTTTSCTYDFPPEEVLISGTADFTKVVAVGNSLTAGFMDGALYDAGQSASFANIVAQQIKLNGGGEFNQPDIDSPLGNYGTAVGIPGVPDGTPLGRLHLVGVGDDSPAPQPIIPGDPFNTSYNGDISKLNNFGVPGIRVIDLEVDIYSTLNPYYGRFASAANATVLGDAVAAKGTFFTLWLGGNDVLGYAVAGATGNENGDGTSTIDMTPVSMFAAAYGAAISAMTTNGAKGIVANVPSVQDIPHFTTVTWDFIEFDESDPVDAGTIAALNAGYATYNGTLDQLVGSFPGFTQEEADSRKIVFADGANAIVIMDNTLTDITSVNPALVSMRMANSNDLITISAGAELPKGIGVSSPLGEQFTLIESDQIAIADRIADFNAAIAAEVTASNGNLALLDINAIFADFAQNGAIINGAGMDATIEPPLAAFSLDGVHPNQRGSAYVASLFIDKINEVFGSNIPNINPNNWPSNEVPVP